MSSRGAGAALALIAAAFLAVSVATPVVLPGELALFAGHPTRGGHTERMREVYVGLLDAKLCNTGGDGKCSSGVGSEKLTFRIAAYGELGATALLVLAAVALALLTLKKSERRKSAAKLVQLASVLAIIGAAAMLVEGPFSEATIPIGIGMPLYATGVLGALIASLVAVRPPPPLKLRVGDRDSQPIPIRGRGQQRPEPQRQPEAFNVQALFADEPRPGDRGHDSRTRDARQPVSRADDPANSSDPFAPPEPPEEEKRSFAAQLRPLYDAAPQQGGTGGLLPIERPALPFSPPAPVVRGPHGGPGVAVPPPLRGESEAPRTVPPPMRAKPATAPPATPVAPPSAPPLIVLPANAPTVIAAPIDPSLAAAIDPPASAAEPAIGLPMIAVPSPPITQVSLVPPMPDNDLPIGPPTAVTTMDGGSPSPAGEPTLFPRPDTPLAPPPSPVASTRPQRDSQSPPRPKRESQSPPPPPRPKRESQSPPRSHVNGPPPPPPRSDSQPLRALESQHQAPLSQPFDAASQPSAQTESPTRDPQPARAMRASVPMPARPGRAVPGPSQPPPPPSAPLRIPPPRPTISSSVPPPPNNLVIPAIPPIPAIPRLPKRVEPEPPPPATATDFGDTISRVPLEITDNASPTSVSVTPGSDEITDAADDAGASGSMGSAPPTHLRVTMPFHVPDTSPTDPVETADRANPTDPNGEPVTVPARSDRSSPLQTASPARERMVPRLPISTAPESLPPPRDNKPQNTGPSPACPQCESPMAWVEEHLRFYCKSCRMYF